jgi:hypothetical protein
MSKLETHLCVNSYQMLFGLSATFIHRTRDIRKLSLLTGVMEQVTSIFTYSHYAYIYRSIEAPHSNSVDNV